MRIALTQRVEQIVAYGETRDCLDRRWHELLAAYGHFGIGVPNLPNSVVQWCEETKIEGIILTGGNDIAGQSGAKNIAVERDDTERVLIDYAKHRGLPVLAVCRGLQLLNLELGGALLRVDGHVAEDHKISILDNPFCEVDSVVVNSYHGFAIPLESVGSELIPWGTSNDGMVEAVYHQKFSCIGIMWHPERSASELDAPIIRHLFGFGD